MAAIGERHRLCGVPARRQERQQLGLDLGTAAAHLPIEAQIENAVLRSCPKGLIDAAHGRLDGEKGPAIKAGQQFMGRGVLGHLRSSRLSVAWVHIGEAAIFGIDEIAERLERIGPLAGQGDQGCACGHHLRVGGPRRTITAIAQTQMGMSSNVLQSRRSDQTGHLRLPPRRRLRIC